MEKELVFLTMKNLVDNWVMQRRWKSKSWKLAW